MKSPQPVEGHFSELVIGGKSYRYATDMEALEMAEKLPEVRWQIRLKHNRGIVDSEKYHRVEENYR